jgi:hypothetical protein
MTALNLGNMVSSMEERHRDRNTRMIDRTRPPQWAAVVP